VAAGRAWDLEPWILSVVARANGLKELREAVQDFKGLLTIESEDSQTFAARALVNDRYVRTAPTSPPAR
jgi:hypothetical protein